MWTRIEGYDYAVVPEGEVKVMVVPVTNRMAQLLTLNAVCEHYVHINKQMARFRINVDDNVGVAVYYLDLSDYVVTHWRR